MRQILCPMCGQLNPTPTEDIIAGKIPRRNEGRLKSSAHCDNCNKHLNPGDSAIALTFPRNIKFWEADYFNF